MRRLFAATAAKEQWPDIAKQVKKKRGFYELEEFCTKTVTTLELGEAGDDFGKFVRETVLKDLKPALTKKNTIRDGSCLMSVVALLTTLGDEKSINLLLSSLEPYRSWEDHNRAAYTKLGALARQDKLTKAQVDTLKKAIAGLIGDKKAIRQAPFTFEAVRAIGNRDAASADWAIALIADDCYQNAKKTFNNDPVALEQTMKLLGDWWGAKPGLALRIPVLLEGYKYGAPTDSIARDGLRRLTFQNFGLDGDPSVEIGKHFKKWWKDAEKSAGKSPDDSAILKFSLKTRMDKAVEDGDEKVFRVDVERLIQGWNTPQFKWATPILVWMFTWDRKAFGELTPLVNLALRRIKDPASVDALMKLMNDLAADPLAQASVVRTLGALARKDQTAVVDDLRLKLRGVQTNPLLRSRCAEALGRIGVTEAIDELINYAGQAAAGQEKTTALTALARLGGDKALGALEKAFDEANNDERASAVEAMGRFATHPFPDKLANKLLAVWAWVEGGDLKKNRIAFFKDTVIDAMLGGRLDVDMVSEEEAALRTYRGIGHASFINLLRDVALDPDPKSEERARKVLKSLVGPTDADAEASTDEEAVDVPGLADLMFDALELKDADRTTVALAWIERHVRAKYRDNYINLFKNGKPHYRIVAARILSKAPAWDPETIYPVFIEVIRTEGEKAAKGDDGLVKLIQAIVAGMRQHPAKKFVPELFAMMADGRGAEFDWLTMQLHGVLFAWITNSNAGEWAVQLRRSKRSWEGFWKKYGEKIELQNDETK
jgi:HEAT repeat protein